MKAIRHILPITFLLFLASASLNAQKAKFKVDKGTGMVTKDGADFLKIDRKGCKFNTMCKFSIYDESGTKIIVVSMENFRDPAAVEKANPEGIVRYAQYYFPKQDMKCEVEGVRMNEAKLAKDIYMNELVSDERALNEQAVKEFVEMNGMRFSEQKSQIIRVITN